MITRGGEADIVKVLDFGIAKTTEAEAARERRLTSPGMAMGTPEYMAPEQAAGRAADARTDIYSLGAIMYEMCTGQPPYSGDNFMEILTKKATQDPPPPTTVRSELPQPVSDLVMSAMARNPERAPAVDGRPRVRAQQVPRGPRHRGRADPRHDDRRGRRRVAQLRPVDAQSRRRHRALAAHDACWTPPSSGRRAPACRASRRRRALRPQSEPSRIPQTPRVAIGEPRRRNADPDIGRFDSRPGHAAGDAAARHAGAERAGRSQAAQWRRHACVGVVRAAPPRRRRRARVHDARRRRQRRLVARAERDGVGAAVVPAPKPDTAPEKVHVAPVHPPQPHTQVTPSPFVHPPPPHVVATAEDNSPKGLLAQSAAAEAARDWASLRAVNEKLEKFPKLAPEALYEQAWAAFQMNDTPKALSLASARPS